MEKIEQMIDFLQSYSIGSGFQDLDNFIIGKNNCILCGTCVSLCPRITIKENKPKLSDYDPDCSLCFRYCAKTYFPEEVFQKEIFDSKSKTDFLMGFHQKATLAKSTSPEILKLSQNGGIVTTLLIHALNSELIDGVLLTSKDENWYPKPFIAKTPKEVLNAAGSKYSIASTLITYSEAINKYKLEKLAFVGMPCQIKAVRKLQLCPPLSDKFGRFKLIIGLFCHSNYSYDLLNKLIDDRFSLQMSDIQKFDIANGKFIIKLKDHSIKTIPIEETKKYYWISCRYCRDYTAKFADISVGNVGAPKNDWNSVLIRTDIGLKLFNDANNAKKLKTAKQIDISQIKKQALRKKSQIVDIDKKIISVIKLLGISDEEIKGYITLLSIGYADIPLLSRIMNIDEQKVYKILSLLKKREWIISQDGRYSSVHPIQVLKNEINEYKKHFENIINKIKSEALEELEDIFLQNNINHIQYDDLIEDVL